MKRIFGVTIAAILCYAGILAGNPILYTGLPLISEVQVSDSIHWSIELGGTKQVPDGSYNLNVTVPYIHPPCSTTLFRLRVASSGNVYSTNIYFDTASIAVLTRASLTGIPQNENVVIHSNDTIQILDTAWHDTSNHLNMWRFVVRPVKPGNSLVDMWYGGWRHPFETTRPSIGSRGNYTTLYNLYLRDSLNNLLSKVYYYNKAYVDGVYNTDFVFFEGVLSSSVVFPVAAGLSAGSEWRGFSCDSITNIILMQPSSFPSIIWNGSYIDTVLSIQDTVICPCAPAQIKKTPSPSKYGAPRFSALPRSNHGITFVIATPDRISRAAVQIFSMTGKTLASLEVPAIDAQGTYSLTWDGPEGKISAGTYLCKLVVNDAMIASQKVTVR